MQVTEKMGDMIEDKKKELESEIIVTKITTVQFISSIKICKKEAHFKHLWTP